MRKSFWLIVGLVMALACALNSEGADYAGWTVGNLWGDGHATILRSTDSGVTWSRQGVGQVADAGMYGVVAVDPFTAWVVGDSSAGYATIYHTTDGGLTWNRKGSAAQVPDTSLLKVAAFGDGHVWAVGVGTILHSANGGASWENQIPTGYESVHLQGIHTPDGVNVWATGESLDGYATILKSSNGGLNWTRQSGGDVALMDHILGVSAVDANTAWAMGGYDATSKWRVLGTTNGGASWTQQNNGQWDGNEICAVDASTVWAVADTTITRSTDGGANWDESGFPPYIMGISAVDSHQAWAVSTGLQGAIHRATDGGASWETVSQVGGENLPGLWTVSFSREAIPEPSTAALLILGLAAMLGRRRNWPRSSRVSP